MADPMPCLIVECSEAEAWPSLYTGEPPRFGTTGPVRIPQARQPAILQPDRETAEREAMRLAQTKGAGKVFVIFEAVAAARMVTVHSHTTLGGKLTGEQLLPRVLDLGEDNLDEIPF